MDAVPSEAPKIAPWDQAPSIAEPQDCGSGMLAPVVSSCGLLDRRCIPYDDLRVPSQWNAPEIDALHREAYLSDAEFEQVFGITRDEFSQFPQWKQLNKKKELKLF